MGEVPYWYRVIKGAQYLKVAPWELAEQPVSWLLMAEEASNAEAKAEQANSRKHKARGA